MRNIGDKVDYQISGVWMSGIIREINIPMCDVRADDELFTQTLPLTDVYDHDPAHFEPKFPEKPVGSTVHWEPCGDENYWSDDPRVLTIVKAELCGRIMTFTENNCPYGWNVLCRMDAKKADIIII